jgi:hypothetical protein
MKLLAVITDGKSVERNHRSRPPGAQALHIADARARLFHLRAASAAQRADSKGHSRYRSEPLHRRDRRIAHHTVACSRAVKVYLLRRRGLPRAYCPNCRGHHRTAT